MAHEKICNFVGLGRGRRWRLLTTRRQGARRMLPVTIEMRDHMRQEKTGDFHRPAGHLAPNRVHQRHARPLERGPLRYLLSGRPGAAAGIVILGQVTGDVSIFDRPGAGKGPRRARPKIRRLER